MNVNDVPVIAIDGPSASGKGTVAQRVAENWDFIILTAARFIVWWRCAAIRSGVDLGDESTLSDVASDLMSSLKMRKSGWRTKTLRTQFARKHAVTRLPELLRIRRSEKRCWSGSANFATFLAWWQMDGTWVRWCFPMPFSKFFLPQARNESATAV